MLKHEVSPRFVGVEVNEVCLVVRQGTTFQGQPDVVVVTSVGRRQVLLRPTLIVPCLVTPMDIFSSFLTPASA